MSMKKAQTIFKSLLILPVAVLLLTSCNKDDDPVIANETDLIGVWDITGADVDIKIDGQSYVDYLVANNVPREQAEQLYKEMQAEMDPTGTMEFKEDGTYENVVDGVIEDEGTYELIEGGEKILMDKDTEWETTATFVAFSATSMKVRISEKMDMNFDMTMLALKETVPTMEMIMVVSFSKK